MLPVKFWSLIATTLEFFSFVFASFEILGDKWIEKFELLAEKLLKNLTFVLFVVLAFYNALPLILYSNVLDNVFVEWIIMEDGNIITSANVPSVARQSFASIFYGVTIILISIGYIRKKNSKLENLNKYQKIMIKGSPYALIVGIIYVFVYSFGLFSVQIEFVLSNGFHGSALHLITLPILGGLLISGLLDLVVPAVRKISNILRINEDARKTGLWIGAIMFLLSFIIDFTVTLID